MLVKRLAFASLAVTDRTYQQILEFYYRILIFLDIKWIEPTNNASERALRQSMIQRKISYGAQSIIHAIRHSRLLTVTTNVVQQGRYVWQFL